MRYLRTYKTFEGRQRSDLYHLFDMEKCIYILENNALASYKFNNISTTRNKMMNSYLGDGPVTFFKLQLDGDKISDNYKIKPFQYQTRNSGKLKEWEEVIKTRKLTNLNKYVKKFIIIKDNVERMKDSGWFDTDGGNLKGDRRTIPSFFKEYLPKIKDLFGDIYVQDGAKIHKDDGWIESIINTPIKQINHGYALYWRGQKKVKKEKWSVYVDDIIPLDDKNKPIENLVIGYDYEDLYLSKNKNIESDEKHKEDYKLYIFDYEYELEDIIDEDDDTIYLKKAKLTNIDWSINESYQINDIQQKHNGDIYYFNTPKYEYEIKILRFDGKPNYWSVGFGISEPLTYNTSVVANENPYEVMDTVFGVMKDFTKTKNVEGFIFSFRGNKDKNEQRLLLYKRAIKKHFPEAKLEFEGGIYYIVL